MQLRCVALKVHCYLYKCRSWPRIGRMSCGSARASGVLEVKVKMRRFGEKEMMGRRVWGGGKVEPVYEPISFSAKASPSSIYYFMPPICYFMADCTFWGANCLLTDCFTAFYPVWEDLEIPPSIISWPSAHSERQGCANSRLESGAKWLYFTWEWVLFPPFSHLRWRKWLIGI